MNIKHYFPLFLLSVLTSCTGYIVENDGVYYKSWDEGAGFSKRLLKDLDPKTFEILENNDYCKDAKFVYHEWNPINGADPNTFKLLNAPYSVDKNRAYYGEDSIESSSSKDFQIIDDYYSSDCKDIYYKNKPLHVCNTKNFKIFPPSNEGEDYHRWATDGCYYYFMNSKIPSEDYKDVVLLGEGFAKDNKWVYFFDRKLNFDKEGNRILDTVDLNSFTVTDIECKDKFGCINPFHGRKECPPQMK